MRPQPTMLEEEAIEDGLELYLSVTVATIHGFDVEIDVFPDDVTRARIDVARYIEYDRTIGKAKEGGDWVLAQLHI